MRRFVEFDVAGGKGTVRVEVERPEGEGRVAHAALPEAVTQRAEKSFEEGLAAVRPAANALLAQMKSLARVPERVEVEFGITMDAEFGAFIAKAGLEANFKVTLTWEKEE